MKSKKSIPLLISLLLLLSGCVTVAQKETLEMQPMYGLPEAERDPYLQSEDDAFVKRALARFEGDHRTASRHFSTKGSELLGYGELHNAMVHFNRAWLLDRNNAYVYWGFGQVQVVKGELDSAIEHLERANQLGVDGYQRPALLVDTGIAHSIKASQLASRNQPDSTTLFGKANDYFELASRIEPGWGEVWRRWSFSLYREGRYQEAWRAVDKARLLGAKQFPPSFLKQLNEAYPQPSS